MSPATITAILKAIDLIEQGIKLYNAYRRMQPLKRYREEIQRLNKELAQKDSKLTTSELLRILNV